MLWNEKSSDEFPKNWPKIIFLYINSIWKTFMISFRLCYMSWIRNCIFWLILVGFYTTILIPNIILFITNTDWKYIKSKSIRWVLRKEWLQECIDLDCIVSLKMGGKGVNENEWIVLLSNFKCMKWVFTTIGSILWSNCWSHNSATRIWCFWIGIALYKFIEKIYF